MARVIFGSTYTDDADFERFARRAKQSGATHINVSNSLPWSFWQYDTPGDPYPSWVISNPALLKIAQPKALQPYLPREYGENVLGILERRGKILKRLGLRAAFTTFEPQMLPERVFSDHPLWRGPRVDHPVRSRVARFAPSIDRPEVLALYRESAAILLRRCPELEMISLQANDSGAGIDWGSGLYAGPSGNMLYQRRSMADRLRGFFTALRDGAQDAGGSLEIDIWNTREPNTPVIASGLSAGMGIDNLEGPRGTPYKASAGFQKDAENYLYPVLGIPQPVRFLESLEAAAASTAPRLVVAMGDRMNRDLYFDIYDRFRESKISDTAERLAFLKQMAGSRAGPAQAGKLLSLWENLHEAHRYISLLNSGGTIFYLGCVQQRWLTRPFVPLPSELRPEEREYYRKFQFQARTEEHANSLVDLQGSDVYTGWSGRFHTSRILGEVERNVAAAGRLARGMGGPGSAGLVRRLEVFHCLIRTARNAVSYQAQLDRVRRLGSKPETHPVAGTKSGWDRQLMLDTARNEIDNAALLIELLGNDPGEVLHIAASKEEEDIRVLGPELREQLRRKTAIMNAHWQDYSRIFTSPNP